MAEMTLSIPSLTGGVSTQPEPLRLPGQAESSTNWIASVIEGLQKRSPTEYQSTLLGYPSGSTSNHPIHGVDGNFLSVFSDEGLSVYDLDDSTGQPLTIRNTSGALATSSDFSYLETSDPQGDLRFLTLADYTLVLNRKKVTAKTGQTASMPSQALVHVQQGAYRKYYRVKVQGATDAIEVQFGTYGSDGTPPDSNIPPDPPEIWAAEDSVKTESIAAELEALLKTGNTSGSLGGMVVSGNSSGLPSQNWEVTRSGSVIRIVRLDGSDFTMSVSDSSGDTLMKAIHKQVQLFSDLPVHAPVGMRTEVIGDPSDPDAGYWAQFVAQDQGTAGEFADGYWEESVAPEINLGMDPATMPHALIRQANGEFQWTPLDGVDYLVSAEAYSVPSWGNRSVGDEDSNADPDFLGKTIRDMCFHEGRLGLLSDDALSLSETREPFNFYRTTVVDTLDTERIELKASHVHGDQLSHATPLGSDIILFSDGMQFLVRADGALTPNSVSLITVGKYDSKPATEPIQVRDSLFVPTDRSSRAAIHEMKVMGDRRPRLDRTDLTAVATDYVGRARTLTTSPQLDLVAVTSDDEQSVWVYSHFFAEDRRVSQAWQKWTFTGSPTIRHAWFEDTDLWMVMDYSGSVRLLKIRCAPYTSDGGETLIHLDERVDQTQAIATPYNIGQTAIIWPFIPAGPVRIVEKSTGKEINVSASADNVIIVDGEHLTTEFWGGETIDCQHDLSRVQRFDENQQPVVGPELHLGSAIVHYDNSGPFDVVVVSDDGIGEDYTTKFTGPYLGIGANYQKMRTTSGRLKVSIRGRSQERRLSIRTASPWPVRIVSMDLRVQELRQFGARS